MVKRKQQAVNTLIQAPVNYLSYLLRLWRTEESNPWRASLEDSRTGERVGFGSLEGLFAFLREETEPAAQEGVSESCAEQQEPPS